MKSHKLAVCAFVLFAVGCGKSPTAPTPPPPPPPVNIAGEWTGTFESSNYQANAMGMVLNQTGATVTGTWGGVVGSFRESGTVSGTVDASSFTGTITYSANNGPTCQGAFSGPSTTATLNWSSVGFTGNCGLLGGNPVNVRFVLQRR